MRPRKTSLRGKIEMQNFVILTGSAAESNRLQQERWIPSNLMVPVTLLHRGVLRGMAGGHHDVDLFYTDDALDALVESANRPAPVHAPGVYAAADTAWRRWREDGELFQSRRPFEAWEWLHESSIEELADRNRASLASISSVTKLEARSASLSYLDLINFERRHCARNVRNIAAERLVRIAPARIRVTEEQELGVVTIRATWTALAAADRKAPEWLAGGLDAKSPVGAE